MTVTSTTPDPPAGALAVIDVPLDTVALAWAVPKDTVAPATKPVPLIVTVVPPLWAPPSGVIPVTVGAP